MSLIITMYVREGIVMASDSRLNLNERHQEDDELVIQQSVIQSDSSYKTFLAPNNVGISTFGDSDIEGVLVASHIKSFIHEQLSGEDMGVDQVPQKLLEYFGELEPTPAVSFSVAGYALEDGQKQQQVWRVDVENDKVERINPDGYQGAQWGGEADILKRLLQPVAEVDDQNRIREVLSFYRIPWHFFTLQDAIDFCVFAIRLTVDAIRFMPRPQTVGGPIDVLVIKPDEAFWVQRKELHV